MPLIRPAPARLGDLTAELEAMYERGIFTNYGPWNTVFEERLSKELFDATGHCLTVCNATAGLMLALKQAVGYNPDPRRRYALMPAFTFAATAQAALWAGLTPLFCDIDPRTWLPCTTSVQNLLSEFKGEIGCIVPCATFGNPVDLDLYGDYADREGCALVVDAAAALGATTPGGRHFGEGSVHPIVFSMHATKAFATLEGGVIYCADAGRLDDMRIMANFGTVQRVVQMPGFNAKMNEVTALLAARKLDEFGSIANGRCRRDSLYRQLLPGFDFQHLRGATTAPIFATALVPPYVAASRDQVRGALMDAGIETGIYYAPHLAQHPYLAAHAKWGDLSVTEDVCARIINLPASDHLSDDDVSYVAETLRSCCLGKANSEVC